MEMSKQVKNVKLYRQCLLTCKDRIWMDSPFELSMIGPSYAIIICYNTLVCGQITTAHAVFE